MSSPNSGWQHRSHSGFGTASSSTARWTHNEEIPMGLHSEKATPIDEKITLTQSARLTPANVDALLPPPAIASTKQGSSSSSRQKRKQARIDGGLRVRWERLRRRLGTGTSPSTSSIIEESTAQSSITAGRAPITQNEDGDEVDEVVIDRNWQEELKSSTSHSEQGASPEKSNSHHHGGTTTDHDSLFFHATGFWASCWPLIVLRWRVWPAIVDFFVLRFMDQKAEVHYAKESWFMRKSLALWASVFLIINWVLAVIFLPGPRVLADDIFYYGITPALTFPILGMVMYDWPRDKSNFYQVFLTFSIWCWAWYQIADMYACGYFTGTRSHFTCGTKDFLATFYYTTGMQTIALFGLKMKRLPALIGAVTWFVLTCVLILPARTSWVRNVLNFAVFHGFLIYVHYMRETAERRLYTLRDQLKVQFRATQKAQVNERKASDSKRRLTSYVFHEVRVPLNTALLATQNMEASGVVPQAQEIEFKALEGSLAMMSKVLNDVLDFNRMDSGRFESVFKPYPFHQVMRSLFVPLRLAADARNLSFITDLDKCIDEVARRAAYTARGLSADQISSKFEVDPYADGIVVGDETRLMQIITNLASNACKFTPQGGMLKITTRLIVPACACGFDVPPGGDDDDDDDDRDHEGECDDEDEDEGRDDEKVAGGRDVGQENPERRKQSGNRMGKGMSAAHRGDSQGSDGMTRLSANKIREHNARHERQPESIVVRIEVTDTGYGIPPKEMVQSKLFSAFNQTERGKQQGGKGTGLGLALVRQIVKRSGGRLGVMSKVGKGSTFWVELPFGVGAKAIVAAPSYSGAQHAERKEATGQTTSHALAAGMMENATATLLPTVEGKVGEIGSGPYMAQVSQTPSALQSLMEQGGRVEFATRSSENPSNPSMITRTLKDTLNGIPISAEAAVLDVIEPGVSTAVPPILDEADRNNSGNSDTPTLRQPAPHMTLPPRTFDAQGQPMTEAYPTDLTTSGAPSPAYSTPPSSAGLNIHTSLALPPHDSSAPESESQPLQPPPRPSSTQPQPPPTPPPTLTHNPSTKPKMPAVPTGLHVLVVDDDPLTRMLMNRMLTRLGCVVSVAENGEIALEMICGSRPVRPGSVGGSTGSAKPTPSSEEPPSIRFADDTRPSADGGSGTGTGTGLRTEESKYSIVFLDNQMPVLSGLKAVAKLREMGRTDFVVGVTGNALLSDQEEYLEAGVDYVLTKPVLERSLRNMLVMADDRNKHDATATDPAPPS